MFHNHFEVKVHNSKFSHVSPISGVTLKKMSVVSGTLIGSEIVKADMSDYLKPFPAKFARHLLIKKVPRTSRYIPLLDQTVREGII